MRLYITDMGALKSKPRPSAAQVIDQGSDNSRNSSQTASAYTDKLSSDLDPKSLEGVPVLTEDMLEAFCQDSKNYLGKGLNGHIYGPFIWNPTTNFINNNLTLDDEVVSDSIS